MVLPMPHEPPTELAISASRCARRHFWSRPGIGRRLQRRSDGQAGVEEMATTVSLHTLRILPGFFESNLTMLSVCAQEGARENRVPKAFAPCVFSTATLSMAGPWIVPLSQLSAEREGTRYWKPRFPGLKDGGFRELATVTGTYANMVATKAADKLTSTVAPRFLQRASELKTARISRCAGSLSSNRLRWRNKSQPSCATPERSMKYIENLWRERSRIEKLRRPFKYDLLINASRNGRAQRS